jgi:hypothetical protein
MAFDVEAARKAGYTDAEIAQHLSKSRGYDLDGAKSSGYSDSEVIAHLSKRTNAVAQIPAVAVLKDGRQIAADPSKEKPAAPAPSMLDRLQGVGEAALTVVTGATGGSLGMIGGMGGAMAGAAAEGEFGQRQAADRIEQGAMAGADALTYAPRSATGQEYVEAIGRALQHLIPIAAVAPALIPRGSMAPAAQTARTMGAAAADQVATAAPKVAQRVQQMVRPAGPTAPTPGTLGSVGAAGTDAAGQRVATAGQLPVPIKLTKGQATRDFEQLRFEGETAKDPSLGTPLRNNAATQNRQLAQNFEAMVDQTGAQATTLIETGRTVDQALTRAAAKRKAEYRMRYKEAEKAGEMEQPVSTQPLVAFLEENASANAPELAGASLGIAQRELIRLGGAEMIDGKLVARDLPLGQMELVRRQVGNAISASPDNATNTRMGVMLRNLIDEQTEGMGGDLYKQARKSRQRYAQLFEDNAIVRDLLRTRRGTADRQVALEDVFRRTVLNGDRESLGALRRTLQVAGGEEGAQAWKELQGATARHLLDEATKGVATDTAGNPIFSAAKLNNAVRAMDVDGRMEFVLGKRGAQTVRDLNEISKVVMTLPPGSVNTSNTASVLLAALAEAGATGSLTGLPVPVVSGLRALTAHVKDKRVAKRVQDAISNGQRSN